MSTMREHTPSQAEGEADEPGTGGPDYEYTTPSQAEGERDDTEDATEDATATEEAEVPGEVPGTGS